MLTTLRIRNLALVTDLTVEFGPGLNVITGETGAGKSILLGALSLVLGERADRTLIRSGADTCAVEAIFDVLTLRAPLTAFLEENGLEPCDEHQLLLKRTFTAAGTNRQFINGSPTTLQILSQVGEWLVDIHGPHDHQSLLHPARQLAILDAYGGLDKPRALFAERLREQRQLEADKAALVMDEAAYAQQLDLLRFQTREIESARLDPEEEEIVLAQFARSQDAARLLELGQAAASLLDGEEDGLLTRAGVLGRTLRDLQQVDAGAAPLAEQQEGLMASLQELQEALTHYLERVELEPEQLQALEERVNVIQSLKRKYGRTLAEVLAFGGEARRKLDNLESREEALNTIQQRLQDNAAALFKAGRSLSECRRKAIPKLVKTASRLLQDLGFAQSRLDISLSSLEASQLDQVTSTGLDTVEFQFAPNPGEPPRPLRAIASSGEMARVMLALKTALAAEDEIPVLVFDEVDANVGGETARAVGEKMRTIAEQRQVFCVTHLPAVAGFGRAHFQVTKQVVDSRTISDIRRLDEAARVTELSRMLGGQSDEARTLARALLQS